MTEQEGRLARIVAWLRGGYQEGVPWQDYVPLLEVLHRKLTDAEVDAVVSALIENTPEPLHREEIVAAVQRHVLERPSEQDVTRVVRRLESAGWSVDATPQRPADGQDAVHEDT